MKKEIIKNIKGFLGLLLFTILFLTSCEGDSEVYDPNADVISDLDNGILSGILSENYTLNANVEYKLEGSFVVSSGVTFTIPAGTNIEAHKGGSNIFIAVLQGGKININGTATEPVTMSTYDGVAGGWGGLSIFGGAPSLGQRSVNAAFYGGTNENDNSGTITYLNIIGSGNFLATDENFNGLSLYGVGAGTTINNIAIINGKDDGVEFFGGTVSITNLYLENNVDDSIDWTEGWKGTVTNAYILNNNKFSTAVEADFVQDIENVVNFENPTISNLTLVANFEDYDTSTLNTALQFKNDSGANILGLNIEGYDVDIDMVDAGALSNILIDNEQPDVIGDTITNNYILNSGKEASKLDISAWSWIRKSL